MSQGQMPKGTLKRPARPGRARHRASRIGLPRTLDHESFLGVLSHELRTPVTTIYGGARILATKDLPDDHRRSLANDVGQEAERLYRIIEDIVALLRSERGDLEPAREPVAVGRLIAGAIEREQRSNPELRIGFLGASDAAADEADEALLTHVVRNLLDNAIRYSPAGAPIEVVVDLARDDVRVRVLDQGPPPNEPQRHDIGAPGVTRAGLTGGGLGLFVAARLVKAMDGRSWTRAREEGGAEFGFSLRRQFAGSGAANS
jgi:K+-sensing histidine kinase KdpD